MRSVLQMTKFFNTDLMVDDAIINTSRFTNISDR